jgi:hypothetical protein
MKRKRMPAVVIVMVSFAVLAALAAERSSRRTPAKPSTGSSAERARVLRVQRIRSLADGRRESRRQDDGGDPRQPVMIKAYQSGIPGNGKPFPDGSKMANVRWVTKRPKDGSVPGGTPRAGDGRRAIRRVADGATLATPLTVRVFVHIIRSYECHGRSTAIPDRLPHGRDRD